jgi:hypothetical protein
VSPFEVYVVTIPPVAIGGGGGGDGEDELTKLIVSPEPLDENTIAEVPKVLKKFILENANTKKPHQKPQTTTMRTPSCIADYMQYAQTL